MADRNDGQVQWEETYLQKIERIEKILAAERVGLQKIQKQAQGLVENLYDKVFSNSTSTTNAISGTQAGTYSLPTTIVPASISGGRVTIPTGQRTPYHKARDLAAQGSNYAGFQSISDSMYTFSYPEQNMFAPDFIPILALMHSKLAPALKKDKILISSGTRKKPEDVEWDAHMAGYAVDISLSGDDRYIAADVCWELGLRGVAVGRTFVHVDAGPDPVVGWTYGNIPAYRGPGSKRG